MPVRLARTTRARPRRKCTIRVTSPRIETPERAHAKRDHALMDRSRSAAGKRHKHHRSLEHQRTQPSQPATSRFHVKSVIFPAPPAMTEPCTTKTWSGNRPRSIVCQHLRLNPTASGHLAFELPAPWHRLVRQGCWPKLRGRDSTPTPRLTPVAHRPASVLPASPIDVRVRST